MKRLIVFIALCCLLLLPHELRAQTQSITVANASTTGTTLDTLTAYSSGSHAAVILTTSQTASAVIGITTAGAGTSGSAIIQTAGEVPCVFDGATTIYDYVAHSTTTGGDCHDTGSSTFAAGDIGIVLVTDASAGTDTINLFPTGVLSASTGGGPGTGTQYASSYWATSSSLGSVTPPTTNGFYFLGQDVTGSAAVAPTTTLSTSLPAGSSIGSLDTGSPAITFGTDSITLNQPVTISGSTHGITLPEGSGPALVASAIQLAPPSSVESTGMQLILPGAETSADSVIVYGAASSHVQTGTLTTIGSCSGSTNALTYNTSSHVFGCNTISSSGTVTSFSSGNLSPLFTTSVATSTTTPALSFTLSTAGADTLFGNATGSTAAPSFTSAPVVATLNATTSVSTGTAPSVGTAGSGGIFAGGEGTDSTGASSVDLIDANSTNHCMTAVNNAVNQGCVLTQSGGLASVFTTATQSIATTTFTAITSLAMKAVPASATVRGMCTVTWQQATAASTAEFGIANSVAPTHLYITAVPADSAYVAPTYTSTTATSATAITGALTGSTSAYYQVTFHIMLVNSTSADTVQLYAESGSTSDAVVIQPGSSCGWLP